MVGSLILLYESTETEFKSNGIGGLSEATSCIVTEERNGSYELEMTYPITGRLFNEIKNRKIIFAKPNPYTQKQPFRIYEISKPISGLVRIYAEHISYDLSGYPVSPFTAKSLPEAFQKLKQNCPVSHPFVFHTDRTTEAEMSTVVPMSTRSLLGGVEGSILDTYTGEYIFDRFDVSLPTARGENRGVSIRYGKNLTDLTQEENCSKVFTAVYPYWYALEYEYDPENPDAEPIEKETLILLDEKIVQAEGTYDYEKVYPLDLSDEWETAPSKDQLRDAAVSYMKTHNIGVPEVSLTVSFVDLSRTTEYQNYISLTEVHLCDTVNVEFPKMGVSSTSKCIKTVFNVLTDRYDSIELGDSKATLSSTIVDLNKSIGTAIEQTEDHFRIALTDSNRNLQSEIDMTAEKLTLAVNAERQRAENAESNISSSLTIAINNVTLSVEEERTRASGEEEKLGSKIDLTSENLTLAVSKEVTRAKEVEESLASAIQINAEGIESSVAKDDFKTYMRMYYDQVIFGFNDNSNIIQLSLDGITSYEGSISDINKRSGLDGDGLHLYRNGLDLGYFGTIKSMNAESYGITANTKANFFTVSMGGQNTNTYSPYFICNVDNDLYPKNSINFKKLTYFDANTGFIVGKYPNIVSNMIKTINGYASLGFTFTSDRGTPYKDGWIQAVNGLSVGTFFESGCNLDMGGYSIVNQSDIRLKKNIEDCQVEALSTLRRFQFKEFDWVIDEENHVDIGLIAQQIMEFAPNLVYENPDTGVLSLKMDQFILYTIKAIQELSNEILPSTFNYERIRSDIFNDARNLYSESEIQFFINSYKNRLEEAPIENEQIIIENSEVKVINE